MIDMGDFSRGMECLDQAETLLNRGNGGEPPTAASLEQLRVYLEQARALIGTAKDLIGHH